jgi:hypothetical protein
MCCCAIRLYVKKIRFVQFAIGFTYQISRISGQEDWETGMSYRIWTNNRFMPVDSKERCSDSESWNSWEQLPEPLIFDG